MRHKLEPAYSIIKTLGGLKAVSEITGVSVHTVMRWRYPKGKGTGGIIPHRHQPKMLAAAQKADANLSASSFFPVEYQP